MKNKPEGLFKVKSKTIEKLFSLYPDIPAVKRHKNNPKLTMQFSTALHIEEITNVPVEEIIELNKTV